MMLLYAHSLLRKRQTMDYDNQSRVYQSTTWGVNPTDGTFSTVGLTTNRWYDRRGNLIKMAAPQSPIEKMVYDGAGRIIKSYKTDGNADTTWAQATSVTDDFVITQTTYSFDAAGNTIMSHQQDRFHSASGTPAGQGELLGPTATGRPGRSQYMTMYYDTANRLTDSVNIGTNGGVTYNRPSTVPVPSDVALVTSTLYDAAGRSFQTIDPKQIVEQKTYDLLGRTTQKISNMIGGFPGYNSEDVTVEFTYNGNNQQRTIKALLAGGFFQTTAYIYGANTARGDSINDNRVLLATQYPNKRTGLPSSSEQPTQTTNALGQPTSTTDENGSTHLFFYDLLGRTLVDVVSVLGAGVDGTQKRIDTRYNTQGLIDKVWTSSNFGGTAILTQIQREYNNFGQLAREYQSDNGPVVATTPSVQYQYSIPSATANRSILTTPRASG